MQPSRRTAHNPNDPRLKRLKNTLKFLEQAREECSCQACVGSPLGDATADHTPCDHALELAIGYMSEDRVRKKDLTK